MKPLTILAVTLGALCLLAFSAGSANAADAEWNAVVACVTECKAGSCDVKLGHDRVICNHSCWCECSGLCTGGDVCLDKVLIEHERCEIAGGVALPIDGSFTLCVGIDKPDLDPLNPPRLLGFPELPFRNWKFFLKVDGDFTGMPATAGNLTCDIAPFYEDIPLAALVVARDSAGCLVTSDTARDDIAFLAWDDDPANPDPAVLLDPDIDREELYVEDDPNTEIDESFEGQVQKCVEDLTGLSLVANSNPCPPEALQANLLCCNKEYNYDLHLWECRDVETDEVVPCEGDSCHQTFNIYDAGFDYGLDACDYTYDFTDTDPLVNRKTIFYNECPFEKIRNMGPDEKEYVVTVTLQLLTEMPHLVRSIVDTGHMVDFSEGFQPYVFDDTLTCLIDDAEDLIL